MTLIKTHKQNNKLYKILLNQTDGLYYLAQQTNVLAISNKIADLENELKNL